MKLCPTCQRHVRPSLASCPFCSATLPTFAAAPGQLSRVLGLGLGFAVASCGPSDPSSDDSSTTTTSESTGRGDASSGSVPADSTTTGPLPGTSGVVDSSSGPPATTDGTTTSSDDDTDDGPVGFYGGFDFDSGPVNFECDVMAQDCPQREKCSLYANDGGTVWNATHCVPVVADPDALGEPCQVKGSSLSGIDSCAQGLACIGEDADLEGQCVSLCSIEFDRGPLACQEPGTTCAEFGSAVFGACLTSCDPLDEPACPDTDACMPLSPAGPHCVPHTDGQYVGYAGVCEVLTDCAAGHVCLLAKHVPDCAGDNCCTTVCDPADGDGQCPDVAEGQTCTNLVPGLDACMVP